MGIHKQTNGIVCNGSTATHDSGPAYTPLGPLPRAHYCRQIVDVIKSAIPYLAFLAIYGINPHVHILPRFEDVNCIHLYNVSAFEYTILHCQVHELVSSLHNVVLDFLSAVPYLMHYALPVIYPAFLYFTGRLELISRFYWLMGITMWVMFIIWKFLPTAPPWMYDNMEQYAKSGTTAPPLHLMHREGCAFARLDRLTGLKFFFNMFGGNPVPFASFPSGHVAWPMCIYVTSAPGGRIFAIYVLWVAWATLYSCHHYLSDAVVAALMVVILYKISNYVSEKLRQRTKPLCNLPAVVCSLNIV
ncbi:hypothetical protein LSH36_99g00015 [Paralvinella palmiformis]|uniref:Inositolphosphotransferase Aur1/Ipt1 domain-containing protein n=1 Tax=Paralvinella palmiformis TaxID=53620 RepID=A0AAD9K009_9ANNE|nr:hypothetical protein LSH36_99g00015 [Paralvinella palmiformis]